MAALAMNVYEQILLIDAHLRASEARGGSVDDRAASRACFRKEWRRLLRALDGTSDRLRDAAALRREAASA